MNIHAQPAPVRRELLTAGVWGLVLLIVVGFAFGVYRFLFGLGASTNLNQQYPWGIWIIADVSFIALAAGGFTTAAIVHVFHREHYHILGRPALLVAMLGYTFACCALLADLGKYYNIWHPMLPSCWQGNSALFEVGMCVMCYVTVLYIEFIPIFCERFAPDSRFPRLARACRVVQPVADKVMFVFIILGVGISCLHQSSLGHVMALVPTKLHPLWYSPILALLFLVSAIAVGFPTVILAYLYASWALKLRPQMDALSSLAKYVPFLLAMYLVFKIGDMTIRGSHIYLVENSLQSTMFLIEMVPFLILPLCLFLSPAVRSSPRWLAVASLLAMLGVALNRANVYWIGYHPARATTLYYPSIAEWAVAIGSLAALIFCWRAIAIYFPVLTHRPEARAT